MTTTPNPTAEQFKAGVAPQEKHLSNAEILERIAEQEREAAGAPAPQEPSRIEYQCSGCAGLGEGHAPVIHAKQNPSSTTDREKLIAEAAARARGEALIEAVQAHRDLHKTYGSTVACRGGIGGQALTSHCAEICYNAGAHEKEMEAWQRLEVEAIEYSRARAAEIREGKLS